MKDSKDPELEKIKDIIEDIRIATLVTKDNDGPMRGRPMATAEVDDDGTLWFFTDEYSAKVEEISEKKEVLVSYASKSQNAYVMINGTASLIDDRKKIEELWKPAMKAFFPKGLDDKKILLIRVDGEQAEYWEGSSSRIVIAFNVARSIATGKQYNQGEHGKVDL
jgi:general stress protein 26